MSEDIPRTKIPRFKQSSKASTRIMKSKSILDRIKPQKKKFQKLQNKMPLRQFLQNCAQRKWSATQNKRNKNNQPTIHIPKIEDNSENDRSK